MSRQNVEILIGHAQNVSIKFSDNELINTEVFPIVDMKSPKMKFTRYKRGEQYQSGAHERQPGTEIRTTLVKRDSVSAQTVQYAASDFITREDLRDQNLPANQSPPINLVEDSVEKNAKDLDLRRELAVAAVIHAGTFADGVSGGVDVAGTWLDPSTSTFFPDFDVAIAVLKKNGVSPKKLRFMLDWGTFQSIKRIDDIRDQLKHVSADSLTEDMLARILQIDKVVIGGSLENTAPAEVTEDDLTNGFIWEQNADKGGAFLYHFENPGRKTLNAGLQPRSALDNRQFRITESYFDNKKKATFYDSMEETDILLTATDALYQWKDTILT